MNGKGIILLAVFALGIAGVAVLLMSGEKAAEQKAAVGLKAPLFELRDTGGKVWKLSDLRDKVVLLNFWATWCDSCKGENPSLQRLVDAERGNGAFILISVLANDDPAKAVAYMKTNGFSFPVLIDDKGIRKTYGITGVPETFLIDKKGILKQKVVGPIEWDAPEVKAAIAKLSNE